MTEEITREEAIKTIEELIIPCAPNSKYGIVGRMAISALQDRPIGHWEHYEPLPSEWSYKCSICGCPERSNGHRYCPNCGAKME